MVVMKTLSRAGKHQVDRRNCCLMPTMSIHFPDPGLEGNLLILSSFISSPPKKYCSQITYFLQRQIEQNLCVDGTKMKILLICAKRRGVLARFYKSDPRILNLIPEFSGKFARVLKSCGMVG